MKDKDHTGDATIAKHYVDPVIGAMPIADVTLDDVDEVMAQIESRRALRRKRASTTPLSSAACHQIAQYMRRLLAMAVYPARLRPDNPVP